ncbi:MAG: succinate--CoA ligase subunit alpha [Acidimicrobiales bacterium]
MILVDETTRVVVQGLTGSQGRFHGLRNRAYGTQVVGGVTPGKGGTDVDGIPVFATMAEAVTATAADASLVFVPPRGAADAVVEAADAGVGLVVCITEGIPLHDEVRLSSYLHRHRPDTVLVGPNCPGVISPGRANLGIIPGEIARAGGPVGVVSRSGTLTYQALHELTRQGIGQTTCVGIGGDPVPGTGFLDCLRRFEDDPETRVVILIGEIGGTDEEVAAEFVTGMATPVVAYVAGLTAPPGRRMGHAGAIVSGRGGGARAKIDALERAGASVVMDPTGIGVRTAEVVAALPALGAG